MSTDVNSGGREAAEGQITLEEGSERSCAPAAAVGSAATWLDIVGVGCEPRGISRAMKPRAAWTTSNALI
jgi:hypothetical protein